MLLVLLYQGCVWFTLWGHFAVEVRAMLSWDQVSHTPRCSSLQDDSSLSQSQFSLELNFKIHDKSAGQLLPTKCYFNVKRSWN